MCYLQADVSVAVLQHGDDVAVRLPVHTLPVDADDPVAHLGAPTHTRLRCNTHAVMVTELGLP